MFENAMNIDRTDYCRAEKAEKLERNDCAREKNIRPIPNAQSLALAMAYVPMQCLKNAYSLEMALMAGTLFPELDKPFLAVKGGCNDVR